VYKRAASLNYVHQEGRKMKIKKGIAKKESTSDQEVAEGSREEGEVNLKL